MIISVLDYLCRFEEDICLAVMLVIFYELGNKEKGDQNIADCSLKWSRI